MEQINRCTKCERSGGFNPAGDVKVTGKPRFLALGLTRAGWHSELQADLVPAANAVTLQLTYNLLNGLDDQRHRERTRQPTRRIPLSRVPHLHYGQTIIT